MNAILRTLLLALAFVVLLALTTGFLVGYMAAQPVNGGCY